MTLTGFYNAVPTTATMLFRLGKIFFLFLSFFFFHLSFLFPLPVRTINISCYWRIAGIFPSTRFRVSATVARYVRLGYAQNHLGRPGPRGGQKTKDGDCAHQLPCGQSRAAFCCAICTASGRLSNPGVAELTPARISALRCRTALP